jgi:3-deoxy-D-manno-octulosonate 8-phosphate phosphatase (KDO 8-P phosphatase)
MRSELIAKLRELKIFLFDLDGVLMNDNVPFENCFERVERAAKEFTSLGVLFGIVTAGKEDEYLRSLRSIENCIVFSSSIDKVSSTQQFLKENNIEYKNVFYIGDDLLDIPLLRECGVSCAPKNAKREVKRCVSFIAKADSCDDLLDEIINTFKKSKEAASRATKY